MKLFAVDVELLTSVAAGILDAHGVLLAANPGLLRLFPETAVSPVGAPATSFFVQPSFASLLSQMERCGPDGYRGLLTVGDAATQTRTLAGRVWRTTTDIRLLAEHDIAALERHNDAMLGLTHESVVTQYATAQANVVLKQRGAQSAEESLTDTLTGVGNRRKLDQALSSELSRVRRNGSALSVIMTDIDHFKRINDEFGHGAGDAVLARFGSLLKAETRPTDIVARFGGEEFVVLMPHTTLAQAASKAERFRCALEQERIAPLTRPLTASFGVVEYANAEDTESFLRRVDNALYQAKEGGRNRVVHA